jgi:hypothetical protein
LINYLYAREYDQYGTPSFYMIFKYYGDDALYPTFFYGSETGADRRTGYKSLNLTDSMPGNECGRFTRKLEVSEWINGGRTQTGWDQLTDSIKNLFVKEGTVSY